MDWTKSQHSGNEKEMKPPGQRLSATRNALAQPRAKHPPLLRVAEAAIMEANPRGHLARTIVASRLESAGCYVPADVPLVSTLLMTVIPAQVAGVKNIRVVSPKPSAEVLAAAAMLGVRELYRVGGAQAIAALAYGTQTIPRVDKIVGPGNAYVTTAKKLVSFDCAIDFLAGPTEVVDRQRFRQSRIHRCRSGGASRARY